MPLTDRDRQTLDLEQVWFRYPAAKEKAVRDQFGESSTQYAARLLALIERPEALEAEPVLVGRLRRLRDARRQARRAG